MAFVKNKNIEKTAKPYELIVILLSLKSLSLF